MIEAGNVLQHAEGMTKMRRLNKGKERETVDKDGAGNDDEVQFHPMPLKTHQEIEVESLLPVD